MLFVFFIKLFIFSISFQKCRIDECGEILCGEDDGTVIDDGTGDKLPDFPGESDMDFTKVLDFVRFKELALFYWNRSKVLVENKGKIKLQTLHQLFFFLKA